MKLGFAIQGSLQEQLDEEQDIIAIAVTDSVDEALDFGKQTLRDQTTGAGLGSRLAKSWRSERYPTSGHSMGAAGSIWSNAPHIVEGFSGQVMRSGNGFFLAIPTEDAPKRGNDRKRIRPSNFPEWKLGKLRFVPRPNGRAMLVVDNMRASYARKTGELRGFRRASDRARKSGKGLTTVIMFHLVPFVRLPRAFNVERAAQQTENRLLRALDRNLGRDAA